ncbi:MAG: bifunctional nuclease family protein [Candidatus Obscuribacterales bacterium]|nr:bifunctional nuclease family protein [Candidatus Obscuribacterales bacterium]
MIEMHVAGIAMDARNGHPIVVLNDEQKRRALPIWIGMFEANAITRALDNQKPERPMTHDLLLNTIMQTGFKVKHIEINEIASNTYFATIILFLLDADGKEVLKPIDARPSDAIALALRAKAPIFVAAQVVAEGTIAADVDKDEEEQEEFKKFVDNLKASDFSLTSSEGGADDDPGSMEDMP